MHRNLSLDEFNEMLAQLSRQVDERSDQLGVLEALLMTDSANKKFLPTLKPIEDAWYSSNFGWRIDPFTGQQSFHEGIDFPADVGTTIEAAASGKVIFADVHPAYGKMIEIDHGNGLVSRYAHCSALLVSEGDSGRSGPADCAGRHDRAVDRPAFAFRGALERRAAEPGAFSAGKRLEVATSDGLPPDASPGERSRKG